MGDVPIGPVIVQGSSQPIFRGVGEDTLVCASCGTILAEKFEPLSVLGAWFECFQCKDLTQSSNWPMKGPLPNDTVSLGTGGRLKIVSTVQLDSGSTLASQQEIDRVRAIFGSQTRRGVQEIEPKFLESFKARLSSASDGKLDWALSITRRAVEKGNLQFMRFPIAWAIDQLERALAQKSFTLSGSDGIALHYLQTTKHLFDRWERHPQFPEMATAFVVEFNHSIAMLIAAGYLEDSGNRVGVESAGGGRFPDLYVDLSRSERVSIEVKAPLVLQWPRDLPSEDEFAVVVEKHARSAVQQITGNRGGVVVIGTSLLNGAGNHLQGALKTAVDRRLSKRIAALVGIALNASPTFSRSGRVLELAGSAEVVVATNPQFEGEQFVFGTSRSGARPD